MQYLLMFTLCINSLWSENPAGIKGFVLNAENGEGIENVDVTIESTLIGTCTDEKGYYLISKIPSGVYKIIYSCLGYEKVEKIIAIKPNEILTLNVELKPSVLELPGLVVSAERDRFEKNVEVSHITFTHQEMKSIPSLLEGDLIKTMQLMPGIMAIHDFSNKLIVRGGSPDENLVLMDGIIVYNPSTHLFGLFSIFDPDVISRAEVYTGGYPAPYGDRLSALLDITTKEGNSKKLQGQFSSSLITTKFLIESPVPMGSILLSGRRTYFDALVWGYRHIFKKDVELPYYFYDGLIKINCNPSLSNHFTVTGFNSADVVSFAGGPLASPEKVFLSWGNRGLSGRWRRFINPRLYGEILGVASDFFTHFQYENSIDTAQNMRLYEGLRSYSFKADFAWLVNEMHTLELGGHAENFNVEQSWILVERSFGPPQQHSHLISLYFQDKWSLVPPIFYLQPGIRFLYYDQGKRFIYNPRLGMKYRWRENTTFNFSVGKYNQFLITINSQESYFTIFDFWRPVDSLHTPPVSYHFIGGIEHWFGDATNFTVEPYFKKYYNLLIPKEQHIFFSTPAESLETGSGFATGIDLLYRKQMGTASMLLAYSLAWTKRNLNGESYYPRYDRRHNFNITIGFILGDKIPILKKGKLNLRWFFGSGLPYSEMVARYEYYRFWDPKDPPHDRRSEWRYIPGPRDAYRLPVAHRLDLHYEREMKIFGLVGHWFFDVINLYGKKNTLFYTYDLYDKNGTPLRMPSKVAYSILPIPVPSFGFEIRF
ncbi:MAG: TonB-dependent receptor [bacterium]